MFSFEDIAAYIILSGMILVSLGLLISFFERRHKATLEYEKHSKTEEIDAALNKARIYADRDVNCASMERSILNGVDSGFQTGNGEIDGLIKMALQNPEMIQNLLSSLKK